MKKFFSLIFKNNFYMLMINFLILIAAYFIVQEYMKSAPMKTQIIEGLKYTLVGGYKYAEDKFYFQLSIQNSDKFGRAISLSRPYVKYIVERDNSEIFQITVDDYLVNDSKKVILSTAGIGQNSAGIERISAPRPSDKPDYFNKFIINQNGKLDFIVKFDLKEMKLQRGKYKLIAVINNPERYQIITDFKIGKFKR